MLNNRLAGSPYLQTYSHRFDLEATEFSKHTATANDIESNKTALLSDVNFIVREGVVTDGLKKH